LHKKSAKRDREILKTLNGVFGSAILHQITSHRIEQFKRDEAASFAKNFGGRQEARTPDLRVANERWERPYLVQRARRKRRKPADEV
jgi:hypothetical protein